jgi:hypothetical protein
MSGYGEEAALRPDPAVPGSAFIGKPFTPTALAAQVRKLLDGT